MKRNLVIVVMYFEYRYIEGIRVEDFNWVKGYYKEIIIVIFIKMLYFLFDFLFVIVRFLKIF